MASSGPLYPGTVASTTNAGTSENAENWVSTNNVKADDGAESTITVATFDSPDISSLLVCYNFGFAIPTDATIDGITVEIDRRNSAGAASDNRVQLGKGNAFANLVGTNKANTALDWPASLTVATYGGAADLWGTTWSPADLNSSTFAVFLSVQADANNTDIQVDYVRVTVTYTPANVSGSGGVTIPLTGGAGSGLETFTGTGAVSFPGPALAGDGAMTEGNTGSGGVTFGFAVAGSGVETFSGSGGVTIPAALGAGSGSEVFAGSGGVNIPSLAVSGSGLEVFAGTGGVTIPSLAVSGAGLEAFAGSGGVTIPALTLAGDGFQGIIFTGSGGVTIPALAVAGSGALEFTGSGGVEFGFSIQGGLTDEEIMSAFIDRQTRARMRSRRRHASPEGSFRT